MAGELFQDGNRKYLTADERTRFLKASETHPRTVPDPLRRPGLHRPAASPRAIALCDGMRMSG